MNLWIVLWIWGPPSESGSGLPQGGRFQGLLGGREIAFKSVYSRLAFGLNPGLFPLPHGVFVDLYAERGLAGFYGASGGV